MVTNIDRLAKDRVANAPFDKTYTGTITKVLFDTDTLITDKLYNKYTIKYNGTECNVYINDGLKHGINEEVRVCLPNNILTKKYVEVINIYQTHPDKVVCDSTLHTITEYWNNVNDITKPYKQTYKFTVINEERKYRRSNFFRISKWNYYDFGGFYNWIKLNF